jgi:hemoglobin
MPRLEAMLVAQVVEATLNSFKVPKAEQDELLGILGPLKPEIVEVDSNATGTPLPGGFKAAPPLAKV